MVKPPPDAALADRLILAAIRLTRTARMLTRTSSYSGPQISALAAIVYSGNVVARDLARLEEVTPATISRLIAGLERGGLVRRETDKEDARVQWILPMAKGREVIVKGHAARLAPLAAAIAGLSKRERETLDTAAALTETLCKSMTERD